MAPDSRLGGLKLAWLLWRRLTCWSLTAAMFMSGGTPASAALTLQIEDYATAPMTGSTDFPPLTANSAYLARVNFMAEEPGGGSRFFVNDLNGPLYILDKATKQFTTYLDFNGRDGAAGMFPEFQFGPSGYANGLITFQFDPDYTNNGKFYTVHMELPGALAGTHGPSNTNVPGLNTSGYSTTGALDQPGNTSRHTVLIEWTDANRADAVFQGTARELMRMDMVGSIHPMGDLIFNPTAQPGDPEWGVMYISVGDGGAGESSGTTRMTPQRLDSLGGKILRIVPDLSLHTADSTVSPNGRYRIPNDNPYTSVNNSAVRDELFAVGLRNPHRMSWDVDPENPTNNQLIVNDIGLHTWEEVNIIHPGANYGYSQREGNQVLIDNNTVGPLPSPDLIPVRIDGSTTAGTITPNYPVIQYGHGNAGQTGFAGDSISSGYVYRGSRIPALYGKYIFGEITTGQIFYADYAEMLAADDGDPNTMATIHSIDLLWDDPADVAGAQLYSTITPGGAVLGPMFQIVEKAYEARGGQDSDLPGSAEVTSGNGRADIRLQIGEDGELYILSKSDGMIRAIVGPEANADFDNDGDVDGGDFLAWQRNLGANGGRAPGDADGNGVVDAADLPLWQQRFGQGGAAAVAAPEPGGASLVALALAKMALSRRRIRGPQ